MTADLRKKIRAKLKEHPEEQWWIDLFARVRQSNWLSGRVAGRNGKESFMATLRWVIGKQNLAKIEEGNYDNRTNESSLFRGMNEFLQKEDA